MSLTQLQPYLEAARTSLQEQSGRVTSGRVRVLALLLKAGRPLTHQEVLADLATDELTDITAQTPEEATALIMLARAHWFTGDEAQPTN